MLGHDFPVAVLSQETIESFAEHFAARVFGKDAWRPNICDSLQASQSYFSATHPLRIEPRPDSEMMDAEAYAFANPPRIFIRQSLLDAGKKGDAECGMILLHEVGHLLLHEGAAAKPRMVGGNKVAKSILPEQSAERQAWLFAKAARMPSWLIAEVDNPEQLAELCGIDVNYANERWNEYSGHQVKKRLPADLANFIARANSQGKTNGRTQTVEERAAKENAEINAGWENAARVEGKDPVEFRLCARGFLVRRSHYLKDTPTGWKLAFGEVRSYFDLWSQ